tara:strand:+ start:2446 stop:2784 length:339 start_codon:yes stop_codon:yes gene_type:complete
MGKKRRVLKSPKFAILRKLRKFKDLVSTNNTAAVEELPEPPAPRTAPDTTSPPAAIIAKEPPPAPKPKPATKATAAPKIKKTTTKASSKGTTVAKSKKPRQTRRAPRKKTST